MDLLHSSINGSAGSPRDAKAGFCGRATSLTGSVRLRVLCVSPPMRALTHRSGRGSYVPSRADHHPTGLWDGHLPVHRAVGVAGEYSRPAMQPCAVEQRIISGGRSNEMITEGADAGMITLSQDLGASEADYGYSGYWIVANSLRKTFSAHAPLTCP
jgi:hypothetical protein